MFPLNSQWVIKDPPLDRISAIMNRTTDLDGAYTEYYTSILRKLYDSNPKDFSRVSWQHCRRSGQNRGNHARRKPRPNPG